ncbi:MAG: TonB-dependent receptor [Gemmatimonadales bacterium]|nr:MAG: TonB-dependent receptor [Gemmatimonadales bacterium]
MSRRFPALLAALATAGLLALVPLPAVAQAADVLTGRVTRESGAPISGARVEVMSVELETTRSVLTDGNGRFMLLFPDGGGVYLVRVTFLGMADQVVTIMREASEELLLRDFVMASQAIALEGITATARGGTPGQGQAGEQTTELSQELLNRLPLPDMDPATLALMAAGVTSTGLDSLSGRMGFSVGGMSDLLNEVTLDGIMLGGGDLGVPEEGVRRTQVTTSTFDVSQGGFAGGLVAMTSARGSNRAGGSLSYRFDDDALQMNSSATTNGFRRQNVGGSWGGPVIQNKLFYNVSFQLQDNTNYRFALSADDPLAATRSGVAQDSVGRFLDILEYGYGIPSVGKTGSYNQGSGDLRLSGRMDWNISQGSASSHSLSTRLNLNRAAQDSTRISALDLSDRGGDTERNTHLVAFTLNSRLRTTWTHRLTASFSENWNESVPFVELPEGRVRVNSEWEDGTRSSRTLTFGGNRNMPTEARTVDLQLSNELSFLQPIGPHLHRLKVGGSYQTQRSDQRSTDNLFGSFSYASLDDFAANRPERYERSLTERESVTSRVNAGLFVGDTWRISQPFEVTLGLRWDYSGLAERPDFNPAVEEAFGRRTDVQPSASGWSPRVGFSYRLPQGAAPAAGPGMARSITGGIGYFAGRAPTQVFSQAYRQTGLASSEQRLVCIGSAVPIPDWDLYFSDPMSAPMLCADGGMGAPPVFSSQAPGVTLLNPNQSLPSSLRTDLAYRTQLMGRLPVNFNYSWSLGVGLWGYQDLNLDETRTFTLANEGRTFYGDPGAIVERTGASTVAGSRINPAFGSVFDVVSDRRSSTHQFSTQVLGAVRPTTTFMANYTLGFSRDQGSGGGGMGQFGGGGGGGMFPPTAGSPNEVTWATSSGDRRHTLNLVLNQVIRPEFEVSLIARTSSGAPFTPLVDRDVNGDGLRNDVAFIFDPRTASDPAVAAGMTRLLEAAPSRAASCIESQMGGFADRNSCRNGWTQTLDMRLGIRPNLPRLDRRMTVSVDASNLLTGFDQLVNGRDDMRGWGAGASADPTLLYVRGFDAASQAFRYEVNEGFGQDRRGVNALRAPFTIRLSARVALGGNPAQANRGFGQGGMMGGMGDFGGMGGMGGRGGMGGFGGGGWGGGGGGGGGWGGGAGGGGAAGMGALGPIIGMVMRGETPEPAALLDAFLPNPPRGILALGGTLALTEEQSSALASLADSLDARLAPRRAALEPVVTALTGALGGGGMPNMAALQGVQGQLQSAQPHIEAGQAETTEVMASVRLLLTEAQWEQVPEALRGEGVAAAVRGAGGARGAAGFNAVGMLDRTLVNPLPVVLELADQVGMSDTQMKSIEAVSVQLDRTLTARREELGRRFDGVPAAEQAALFRDIQPQIQRGREEILGAMNQVREILTADQWQRLPAPVRNAGQPPAAGGPGGPGAPAGGQQGAGGGRPPAGGGGLDG